MCINNDAQMKESSFLSDESNFRFFLSLLTDESKLDKALDGWVFSLIINKITTLYLS